MLFGNSKGSARWFRVYGPMPNTNYGGVYTTVKVPAGEGRSITINPGVWRYQVTKGHSAQTILGYWRVEVFADSACTDRRNSWLFTIYSNVDVKKSYTVSYNANGGNAVSAQTKWYGENLTLRGAATRSGFSFVRWNTNASNTGTGYNASASYTANAAITLYAIWNHTVSYNAHGGSGAPGSQTALSSSAITLSSTKPTLANYEFVRWNTNTSNTGTGYAPGGSFAANTASTTLYAIWQRRVIYKANGGTGADVADTSLKTASYTIRSASPFTRSGWRFTGWNTASDGSGTAKSGSYSDGALTLYAQWERVVDAVAFGEIEAVRVESATATEEDDEGTYAYIRVPYTVTGAAAASVSLTKQSDSDVSVTFPSGDDVVTTSSKPQGADHAGEFVVRASGLSTDASYTFTFIITAENAESGVTQAAVTESKSIALPTAYFTMDVLGDGFVMQPTQDAVPVDGKQYYVRRNGGYVQSDPGYAPTPDSSAASSKSYYSLSPNPNLFLGSSSEWSVWIVPEGSTHYRSTNMTSNNIPLAWATSGRYLTISFDVEFEGVEAVAGESFRFKGNEHFKTAPNAPIGGGNSADDWDYIGLWNTVNLTSPPADGVYHYSKTAALPSSRAHRYGYSYQFVAENWAAGRYRYRNFRLEIGDEETGWTPAYIEDPTAFTVSEVASPLTFDSLYEQSVAGMYDESGPRPGHGISFGAPARKEGFNVSMPPMCCEEPWVPTFKTSSIANFVVPSGVEECLIYDTTTNCIYRYTNGIMVLLTPQAYGETYPNSWIASHSISGKDVGWIAKRIDTDVQVGLQVGAGGINHGIWSWKQNKWLLYGDASNVYVNGTNMRGNSSVTCTKSGSYITSGGFYCYRRGNVVTMNVGSVVTTALSARTVVAVVPDGYRPADTVYGLFTSMSEYFIVNPNGNIQMNSCSAGTRWGTATWAIN